MLPRSLVRLLVEDSIESLADGIVRAQISIGKSVGPHHLKMRLRTNQVNGPLTHEAPSGPCQLYSSTQIAGNAFRKPV
jgi:hypothetical protein